MIKVMALGTGVCSSHYHPSADCRRKPPGFLIDCDGYRILLDCSQDIAARLEERGIPMESINAILISHAHPDHNALIHFIQSVYAKGLWGGEKMEKLNVIMPNHLINYFATWWDIYIPETREFPFPTLNLMRPNVTHSISHTSGKEIIIESFPVYHGFGKTESYAFRISYEGKVITYSGDTGVCAGIGEAAHQADLFICEASARIGDTTSGTTYGHLTPFQAGNIAKIAGVKKLFLTHYTGLDSIEAMIEDCRSSRYEGELIIGYDTFMCFLIGSRFYNSHLHSCHSRAGGNPVKKRKPIFPPQDPRALVKKHTSPEDDKGHSSCDFIFSSQDSRLRGNDIIFDILHTQSYAC